jgi:hypothetical protein
VEIAADLPPVNRGIWVELEVPSQYCRRYTIIGWFSYLEGTMFNCCRKDKSMFPGLFFMLLLIFPGMADANESTATINKANAGKHASTHEASPSASFMNWVRRFGNRVGENISEAASKTASAIKNAAVDNKEEDQIEESP